MKVLDYDGLEYYNQLIEDKYFPKTGGTVTGDVSITGDISVSGDTSIGGDVSMGGNIAWTQGEVGYRATTHDSTPEPCKQMIISAGTVDGSWDDGNAKISLHTYDNTGTNVKEDGSFTLRASDGTNGVDLKGYPNGDLIWDNNNVLTSSGGTITGAIVRSGGTGLARRDVNDSLLYLGGGTSDSNGAYLSLYGKDHSSGEGRFTLAAKDGTNTNTFVGQANGTLTWGGKNVERVHASGSGYIRYVSGLQICWGSSSGVTSAGTTITFPVSFSSSPRVALSVGSVSAYHGWSNVSASSITVKTSASNGAIVYYLAVGYWQ